MKKINKSTKNMSYKQVENIPLIQSRNVNKVLSILNKIRFKLSKQGLDTISICISGDQSAGKSAIMTAITGIYQPLNHSMCTRCSIVI